MLLRWRRRLLRWCLLLHDHVCILLLLLVIKQRCIQLCLKLGVDVIVQGRLVCVVLLGVLL